MNIINHPITDSRTELEYCIDYDKMQYLTDAFDAVMCWKDFYCSFEKTHYAKVSGLFGKMLNGNSENKWSWFDFLRCGYAIIIATKDHGRFAKQACEAIRCAANMCCTEYDASEIINEIPSGLGYYLIKSE